MKKIILLAVTLVLTVTASAQVLWNIKGGVGANFNGGMAAKFGVGAEFPLSNKCSLMPALEGAYDGGDEDKEGWIQLPVDIGYRMWLGGNTNLVLKVGPYIGSDFTNTSFGGNLGVNVEVSHLVLGIEALFGSEERGNACFVIGYRF